MGRGGGVGGGGGAWVCQTACTPGTATLDRFWFD